MTRTTLPLRQNVQHDVSQQETRQEGQHLLSAWNLNFPPFEHVLNDSYAASWSRDHDASMTEQQQKRQKNLADDDDTAEHPYYLGDFENGSHFGVPQNIHFLSEFETSSNARPSDFVLYVDRIEMRDVQTPIETPHTDFTETNSPVADFLKQNQLSRTQSAKKFCATPAMPRLMPRPEGVVNTPLQAREAPPTVNDIAPSRKARGRKRSLSPTTREHAAGVRLVGACVRCRKMKEKCDKQQPCRTCLSTARRSLAFPCMKEWPKDRGVYLLTQITTGHLNELLFFKALPKPELRYNGDQPFEIRLRQDFPYHLKIPVQEFNPGAQFSTDKTVFPIAKTGTEYNVQLGKLMSPPLVPVLSQGQYLMFAKAFHKEIGNWLRDIEVDDEADWHETFFHPNYGRAWPRAILGFVCRFFHEVMHQACDAIRFALKTTVLVHMIRHVFYIVPEDVPAILSRMRFGRQLTEMPNNYVCPEHVDRFIKVLLYPILIGCVNESMKQYQNLYPNRKVTLLTRDRFLAASLILLMIAGAQQQTAVERGHLHIERGDQADMSRAHRQVVEIEEQFVDPIFELWDYKFNIGVDITAESDREERLPAWRAKQFKLLEQFNLSYDEHRADLDNLDPELSFEVDVRKFSATNTTRLLKRFYLHVFEEPTRRQEAATKSPISNDSVLQQTEDL